MNSTPQRINEHLEQYWHAVRGERPLPLESDISMEVLKPIWSHCFLLSVRTHGFAYDYLGDQLLVAYGDDITGKEITETLVYPHPASLVQTFQKVKATQTPQLDDSEFVNSHGMRVLYRSCVLPFGARGRGDVAFLLGGMKWKA